MIRALVVLVVLYLLYTGFFFLIQRRVLYPGTRLAPGPTWSRDAPDGHAAREVEVKAGATTIRAWYLPARAEAIDPSPGPAAIVFHGNFELALDLVPAFRPLGELGVSALFVEYPGFGGEPGRPSQRTIMEVAVAAYDWLAARPEVADDRIFALGRSLGTGPAVQLSRLRTLRALVLWSPFASVGAVAWQKYRLPPFLALDRFDTRSALRAYDGPALIFHGTRDRVIPFRNAEILSEENPGVELVVWACAHTDCPPRWSELWEPLTGFLSREGLMREGSTGRPVSLR